MNSMDFIESLSKGGRILKIARMGHPVLQKQAEEIDPQSSEANEIIRDMAATLADWGVCGGLAAPQVFVSKRIFFYNVPPNRSDKYTPNGFPMSIAFNARYKPLSESTELDWEACFSLPDFVGEVPRYSGIEFTYQNRQGEWITEEAWGYKARVIQHETDHLDGILYPMRMKDKSRLGYRKEILKYMDVPQHMREKSG